MKIHQKNNLMNKILLIVILIILLFTGQNTMAREANEKTPPMLKGITFSRLDLTKEMVVFQLNGTYIPKTFALKGEKPRVVFDFYGVAQAVTLPNTIETNGNYVQRIRIGRHEGKSPKTRVVLDLVPGKKVRFSQNFNRDDNTLSITVLPVDTPQPTVAKLAQVPEKKSRVHHKSPSPPMIKGEPKETAIRDTQMKSARHPVPVTVTTPPPTKQKTSSQAAATSAARETSTRESSPLLNKNSVAAQQAASETAPDTPVDSETSVLESIVYDNSSPHRGEMIQFSLTHFHPPKIFGIEEGIPRVVCDFTATRAGEKLPKKIEVKGKWVKTIRIGRYSNPDRVRVVIDLAPNNIYDLQQVFFTEENLFVIIVNAGGNTTDSQPGTEK